MARCRDCAPCHGCPLVQFRIAHTAHAVRGPASRRTASVARRRSGGEPARAFASCRCCAGQEMWFVHAFPDQRQFFLASIIAPVSHAHPPFGAYRSSFNCHGCRSCGHSAGTGGQGVGCLSAPEPSHNDDFIDRAWTLGDRGQTPTLSRGSETLQTRHQLRSEGLFDPLNVTAAEPRLLRRAGPNPGREAPVSSRTCSSLRRLRPEEAANRNRSSLSKSLRRPARLIW